jgi:hypothetical protein
VNKVTYILIQHINDMRRIYTDGRPWPKDIDPTFAGCSIGDGRYDLLEVETRNLKGPRVYDASGLPFHSDNETVIRERIYLDKADPNLLHNDITVEDHALTAPFAVLRCRRGPQAGRSSSARNRAAVPCGYVPERRQRAPTTRLTGRATSNSRLSASDRVTGSRQGPTVATGSDPSRS